jgi:hypothetical protein
MTMWLLFEKDHTVAAIQKYDDRRGNLYAFDSTVSRGREIKEGDSCLYRLNNEIVFVGKIITIRSGEYIKEFKRCPACQRQNTLRFRKNPSSPYKCGNCRRVFSKEIFDNSTFTKKVLGYQAEYDPIDISSYKISFKEVKKHIITKDGRTSPKNQNSITELNSDAITTFLNGICGSYVTDWLSTSRFSINQEGGVGSLRTEKERRKSAYEQNRAVEERAYAVVESYFNTHNIRFKWVGDIRGINNKHCDYQIFNDKGQLIKNVEVKGLRNGFDKSKDELIVSLSRHEYQLAQKTQEMNMMALFIIHSIKVDKSEDEYKARGGELLIAWNWKIDIDGHASPSGYEYRIPRFSFRNNEWSPHEFK